MFIPDGHPRDQQSQKSGRGRDMRLSARQRQCMAVVPSYRGENLIMRTRSKHSRSSHRIYSSSRRLVVMWLLLCCVVTLASTVHANELTLVGLGTKDLGAICQNTFHHQSLAPDSNPPQQGKSPFEVVANVTKYIQGQSLQGMLLTLVWAQVITLYPTNFPSCRSYSAERNSTVVLW